MISVNKPVQTYWYKQRVPPALTPPPPTLDRLTWDLALTIGVVSRHQSCLPPPWLVGSGASIQEYRWSSQWETRKHWFTHGIITTAETPDDLYTAQKESRLTLRHQSPTCLLLGYSFIHQHQQDVSDVTVEETETLQIHTISIWGKWPRCRRLAPLMKPRLLYLMSVCISTSSQSSRRSITLRKLSYTVGGFDIKYYVILS